MLDEVTRKRQEKCAQRPQGHTFTQVTYGTCSNCLLKVNPPAEKKDTK